MAAHFSQVVEIRDAVVDGDVDATRSPARWLANPKGEDFPMPGAADAIERMRSEGRIILAQKEIMDIAQSAARLGATCGACHTTVKDGPTFKVPAEPPMAAAGATPEAHMVRHAWASERLWEGLIGPSEASWILGAAALNSTPMDFGPAGSAPPQAAELEKKVIELAKSAREAHTLPDRAAVYGQLLQTCAACHTYLGMRMSR